MDLRTMGWGKMFLRKQAPLYFFILLLVFIVGSSLPGWTEEGEEPKTPRMTCGKCPEGYATTGVTAAPNICKEGDPTLVQCVPIGSGRLAVCGDCPEGYSEVGSSSVPSQCGDIGGGQVSQCQMNQIEGDTQY